MEVLVVLGGGSILAICSWRLFAAHSQLKPHWNNTSFTSKLPPHPAQQPLKRQRKSLNPFYPVKPQDGYFIVLNGVNRGQRYKTHPVVHIGRHSHNQIVLPSPHVSRFHAQVDYHNAAFVLTPLHNAVIYVNGRRIYGPVPLHHKHYILLGDTALLFRLY